MYNLTLAHLILGAPLAHRSIGLLGETGIDLHAEIIAEHTNGDLLVSTIATKWDNCLLSYRG